MTRTCPQCERSFEPKAKHHVYDVQECRQQGWVEKEVLAAQASAQRVEAPVHSLDEARDRPRLKEPYDRDRILVALKARGSQGIHSHEIRRLGLSGHPSMRVSELEGRGFEIEHRREHKGRRPGVRYVLVSEPGSMAEAA